MPRLMIVPCALIVAIAKLSDVSAFSFTTSLGATKCNSNYDMCTRLRMSDDDMPSDSGSEAVVDVASENYEPTPSENLVGSIIDDLPSDVTSLELSKESRSRINEGLLRLEAMNPTENPVRSPLLNGVWSLRYAGGYSSDWALQSPTRDAALFLYSGGYSPGIFALSLAQKLPQSLVECGELEIAISREQPRVEAKIGVKLLGGASNEVVVKARIEGESDIRFRETYESASVIGNKVDLPKAIQYSRELYVTYVDEDLLVVRDASGVPEVLVRKDKVFTENWGTEPSEADNAVAPGEE